jgi:hypothetical protein
MAEHFKKADGMLHVASPLTLGGKTQYLFWQLRSILQIFYEESSFSFLSSSVD